MWSATIITLIGPTKMSTADGPNIEQSILQIWLPYIEQTVCRRCPARQTYISESLDLQQLQHHDYAIMEWSMDCDYHDTE